MKARFAVTSSAWALILMSAAPSHAQVSARLTVDGDCPSTRALERSLHGVATVNPDGEWGLAVIAGETATDVTLVEPEGTVALARRLDGGSCADRADAVAVILHAHLLDLSLVAPDALTRDSDDSSDTPDSAEPSEESRTVTEPVEEPSEAAEPRLTEGPPGASGHRYSVGLAATAGLGVEPSLLIGSARAELGWKPRGFPLAPRLEIGGRLFEDQRGQEGTLGLRGLLFAATVSLPFDFRSVWFAPVAGAGLALDFAEFSGLRAVEARMLVTGGMELGWMLARPFWIRFDARVDVLPWADSYLVEPVGEVGRSPQAVISLGVALGVRFEDS